MKVNLISLGCPKNIVDSEKLLGSLGAAGMEICSLPEHSDIIIINTCAFIEPAIAETEEVIQEILIKANGKRIYVYGCAVNRYEQRLRKKFPAVSGFFTLEQYNALKETIQQESIHIDSRLVTTKGYAYLKIADGCSNHCSYCTIPGIKGPFKSNRICDLYKEAEQLSRLGVKELILIAQDTTSYGVDIYDKPMLCSLIRRLSEIEEIEWIRIMYAHPKHLTDEIIDEIKLNNKVCKYLDLPIQHINDRVLGLMNRGVTRKQIKNVFSKLNKVKGISLRTTVISGFPTETESEFEELINFIQDANINWLGVFPYYREIGTHAADLDQLSDDIIADRYQKLLKLQKTIINRTNKKKIGSTHKILVHHKNTQFMGHAQYTCPEIDSNILIMTDHIKLGEFYDVRFKDLDGCDIKAEVVK